MKAMILCAGLGTRLKPWTLEHPKALVPVKGVPMLKRVADRLINMGFDELIINVHHFASQIIDYIDAGTLHCANVNISNESVQLLDTGGGILNAERFLGRYGESFLVHNVDILSDADLLKLFDAHNASGNDVTLLVSDRESDRRLVFDTSMRLKGWINLKTQQVRPSSLNINDSDLILSFSGIYVMSTSVFDKMRSHGMSGAFPIMDFFLGGFDDVRINGYYQPDLRLIDIGKPETLKLADDMVV